MIRLTREIRRAELKRESASAKRKRLRDALVEAEACLDRLEYSKALLKNRRSELVCRGLESLKVEPDNSLAILGGAPPKGVLT